MQELLHGVGPIMAFGALGFYALSALAIIGLIWSVDKERSGVATGLLVIYLGVLALTGSFNVFTWAVHHPLTLAAYIGGYLVAGAVWTWFRWEFFTTDIQMKYDDFRRRYLESNKLDELVNKADQDAFVTYAERHGYGRDTLPVRVSRNKSRLYLWCAYWPFSIIWSGLHRPFTFAINYIVNKMGGFLQARSDAKFSRYSEFN